jgi:hypothetical protein
LRRSLIAVAALILNASLMQGASAAQMCAWIVESAEQDGLHKFALNVSVDASTSVAVRFQGPNFTSGAMGGDMISLDPSEPREIDSEGFDVGAGDALSFTVKVFDRPIASLSDEPGPGGRGRTSPTARSRDQTVQGRRLRSPGAAPAASFARPHLTEPANYNAPPGIARCERRRSLVPIRPTPPIISDHVAGSGTDATCRSRS